MREVLRLLPRGRAALAVGLGTLTVLSGAALLAASGALISGAARRPETLLVLLPLIQVFTAPLMALAWVTLLYDLRLRREGYAAVARHSAERSGDAAASAWRTPSASRSAT